MAILRIIVAQCFSISGTTAPIESLETLLRSLGLPQEVSESRAVLEIDKIGRYYVICDSLIRLNCRREYCSILSQLRLQILTALEPVHPLGARVLCRVHGEVQLVMPHERDLSPFPARAIGSSKSAYFLCDLFIAKHGKFGISHTHKRLYEKWTWPQLGWMNMEQTNTFIEIVEAMNGDLVNLISAKRRKPSLMGSAIESRAHLLVLPNGAGITSSTASHATALPNIREETENQIEVRSVIVLASTASSAGTRRRQRRLYAAINLPVEIDVDETTISCTLVVGSVDYIFYTSRVKYVLLMTRTRMGFLLPLVGRRDRENLGAQKTS